MPQLQHLAEFDEQRGSRYRVVESPDQAAEGLFEDRYAILLSAEGGELKEREVILGVEFGEFFERSDRQIGVFELVEGDRGDPTKGRASFFSLLALPNLPLECRHGLAPSSHPLVNASERPVPGRGLGVLSDGELIDLGGARGVVAMVLVYLTEAQENLGTIDSRGDGALPFVELRDQSGVVPLELQQVREGFPDPAVLREVDEAELKVAQQAAGIVFLLRRKARRKGPIGVVLGSGRKLAPYPGETDARQLFAYEGLFSGCIETVGQALQKSFIRGKVVRSVRGQALLDIQCDLGSRREVLAVFSVRVRFHQLLDQVLNGLSGFDEGQESEVSGGAGGERVLGDIGEATVELSQLGEGPMARDQPYQSPESGLLFGNQLVCLTSEA